MTDPDRFPWIKIHRETAARLLEFRSKQNELLDLLREIEAAGLKVINLHDRDPEGNPTELRELDPFSFLASFNRGLTHENRREIWRWLKQRWDLQSPIPSNFDGIPLVNNQQSWFIPYAENRRSGDVDALWMLFGEALSTPPDKLQPALFDRCLEIHTVGIAKLTAGLFWVNPDQYLAVDSRNREYLRSKSITLKATDFASYLALLKQVVANLGDDFPSISQEAWIATGGEGGDPSSNGAVNEAPLPTMEASNAAAWWAISPGESGRKWEEFLKAGIIAIGWDELGDLTQYPDKEAIRSRFEALEPGGGDRMNDIRACVDFAQSMKPGDLVLAKAGRYRLLGYGLLVGSYEYDSSRSEYKHVRRVKWISRVEGKLAADAGFPPKTVTKVTDLDYLRRIREIYAINTDRRASETEQPESPAVFTKKEALTDLFMSEAEFDSIIVGLQERKNIVLQGPPGVGKSFVARRLAYYLLGSEDEDRVRMVQFHQSYSYEDFIEGFRPVGDGRFELRTGLLVKFCNEARLHPDQDYVFIIDEINRGNLSRIFGELMLLIEGDKRGAEYAVPLLYSQAEFHIPANVHFIGLMNTADRSLAMVDYALRRRFRFFTLAPQFGSATFSDRLRSASATDDLREQLVGRLSALNAEIAAPGSGLGIGYQIGHSFFCPNQGQRVDYQWYERIIEGEVRPLLEEYWFDQPEKAASALARLRLR